MRNKAANDSLDGAGIHIARLLAKGIIHQSTCSFYLDFSLLLEHVASKHPKPKACWISSCLLGSRAHALKQTNELTLC
jgi:hypothetical protein